MPRNTHHVIVPVAGYYSEPDVLSGLETQLPYGHNVHAVYSDIFSEFVKVECDSYSSPGYMSKKDLASGSFAATHGIIKPHVNVYLRSDFKSPKLTFLTMSARVCIAEGVATHEGEMVLLKDLGWVFSDQVHLLSKPLTDYVELARLFLGTSYSWGELAMPDCSGLVMLVLQACGIRCPRNVSEQVKDLGKEIELGGPYKKGDLIFWNDPSTKGRHVAIMTDAEHCIHSTIAKPYRGVVEQPLEQAIADQFRDGNGLPTVARRFPGFWPS